MAEPDRGATLRTVPPLAPEQAIVGLVAGAILAVADALQAAAMDTALEVTGTELVLSALHLMAFYLPPGLALGLLLAAFITLFRATDSLTLFRTLLGDPRRLIVRDPRVFAAGVGVVVGLAILGLGGYEAHVQLAMYVHRVDLRALAMGGVTVVLAGVAWLVGSLVAGLFRPVAARIGPFATSGVFAGLFVTGGLVWGIRFLAARDSLITAYGWPKLIWAPLAALIYIAVAGLVRALWQARGPSTRGAYTTLVVTLLVTVAAWTLSGFTYARSNRVRGVVEQRSVVGLFLVRRYARLTDMDDDGHAWAFGGRDCNDFDPAIHPGAEDVAGDGVDSDCFHGDGSPSLDDLGDGHYGAHPPGLRARPNIVLITVDALRPDHLGVAGYRRNVSPNIDRFAEDAVRFESVLAQSSRSIRSIPAMMTGRYPSQILYGEEYLFPSLSQENHTVAELLRDAGYATAVTMGTDYFQRAIGFFQGFETIDQLGTYKPPRHVTVDHALPQLRELADGDEPFFQWIHLYGVHEPYLDPPRRSMFGPRSVDHYDTEIRLMDAEVQRILREIDLRGIADVTVVIIASDHGEAFGEHGVERHSTQLYEEQILSTLLIRAPGMETRVVSSTVALFDVGVTMLNLAGVPVPEPLPARSLLPLMAGEEADEERYIMSELMPDGKYPFDVKALRIGDRKLLWWVQEGTVQYFDLSTDPLEQNDLSDERRADTTELLGLLQAWVAQTNRPESRNEAFVEQHRLAAPPASMTHPLNLVFEDRFTVLGCDIPRTQYEVGERIDIQCYYQVDETMDADLYFRLELQGPVGYTLPRDFHAHHYPLAGRYRSTEWRQGEILRDSTPIVIPPNLRTPITLELTLEVDHRGRSLLRYERGDTTGVRATIETIQVGQPPED